MDFDWLDDSQPHDLIGQNVQPKMKASDWSEEDPLTRSTSQRP